LKVERKLKVETSGKSFSTGNRKVEEAMQATEQRRPIVIAVASAKGGSMKSTLNQEKPWER
jgi:hypothetical protein